MQGNQPIDKGRAVTIVERYPSKDIDPQTRQPIIKNRYATVGRATLWPQKQGSNMPNVELEIDTMPVNIGGSVKVFIFWDSEQDNQQPQQSQQQQQYNQQHHR